MTVSMQSFDGSDLGVFVKSNLNVRGGEDTAMIWHCSRGTDAPLPTIIYELDPADFSVIRSVALEDGVMGEGCGGKADVLYVSQWDPLGEGNSNTGTIMEYPTDAASWATPPLTPDRSQAFQFVDGIGGDTEVTYVSQILLSGSLVYKYSADDWSFDGLINAADAAYGRCDCIGGTATTLWCVQLEEGDPGWEHRIQLDSDDLVTRLQDVVQREVAGWSWEGIGGSSEHVWANRVNFADREALGTLYELDPNDLHIMRSAATPGPNPYGTGGN